MPIPMLDRASIFWLQALCTLLFLVFTHFSTANGQQPESLDGFISGIRANAVKGDVFYHREGGKFPLESGLKLEEGDVIHSSKGAYAELLLQPGNYLRLGGETKVQIFSAAHDKMRLKLDEGALNIEFLSREGSNWWYPMDAATELVRVITGDAEVFINRPGVFRINTTAGGHTEVVVREGEAVINGHRIKKKRRAVA